MAEPDARLPQSSRIEIGVGVIVSALQFIIPNSVRTGYSLLVFGVLIILHGAFPSIFKRSSWDAVNRFYAFVFLLFCGTGYLVMRVVNPPATAEETSLKQTAAASSVGATAVGSLAPPDSKVLPKPPEPPELNVAKPILSARTVAEPAKEVHKAVLHIEPEHSGALSKGKEVGVFTLSISNTSTVDVDVVSITQEYFTIDQRTRALLGRSAFSTGPLTLLAHHQSPIEVNLQIQSTAELSKVQGKKTITCVKITASYRIPPDGEDRSIVGLFAASEPNKNILYPQHSVFDYAGADTLAIDDIFDGTGSLKPPLKDEDLVVPCDNPLTFEQVGRFEYFEQQYRLMVVVHPKRFRSVLPFVLFHLNEPINSGEGLGKVLSPNLTDPNAAGLSLQSGRMGVIIRDNHRYAELWIADQEKFAVAQDVEVMLWGSKPFLVTCANQLTH